jgi:hypothetical protein
MATELQDNSRYRLWKEFIDESKAVTIASVSLIACLLSLLIAGLSVYSATTAKAKVDYELPRMQAEIDQSVKRTDLYIVYMQELYVELKDQGLNPAPLPEE